MSISNSVANVALKGNIQPTEERSTKKNKLEYTDDADQEEPDESSNIPTQSQSNTPSVKKARSDAQKATTEKMRVKLEERRKELVVIKQQAKETALLQQAEVKAIIKEKLKAKQLKTKADEKMRQLLLEASEEEEEEESDHEEVVYRKPLKKAPKALIRFSDYRTQSDTKQFPSGRRPDYAAQELPTIRFV